MSACGAFSHLDRDVRDPRILADKVFFETADQLLDNPNQITILERETLFDIALLELGFLYIFSIEEERGYAIIVNSKGFFECVELFLNASNPFGEKEGLKVYVVAFVYWVFSANNFINASTGLTITNSAFQTFATKAYQARGTVETIAEGVDFISRTENRFRMADLVPHYSGVGGCVPVAGLNIIHFWQRFYPNLLPGFTVGNYSIMFPENFRYSTSGILLRPFVETLEQLMNTSNEGGTTIPNFKSGLINYVNSKGHSVSFQSLMTHGAFSVFRYEFAKQMMREGVPIVLFCDRWTASEMGLDDTRTGIVTLRSTIPHALTAFGYRELTHVFLDGSTKTDYFLEVSPGTIRISRGFMRLNCFAIIDDAYAIEIY
jgi:hypothetical protein